MHLGKCNWEKRIRDKLAWKKPRPILKMHPAHLSESTISKGVTMADWSKAP